MTQVFDAWHLPGLHDDELNLHRYTTGDITARAPLLTADQLNRVIAHVQAAREQSLLQLRRNDIIDAIAAVAARIADPAADDGGSARTLLVGATGYSRETIDQVLQHMADDWSAESLHTLMHSELGDADIGQTIENAYTGRTTVARGPRLAFHIFSGNVPGVAVTSLVRSLLVRAATLGKTASGEPVLPVIFARSLARIAPAIAQCLAITYWPGGSESLENAALTAADVTVVYGGAETVRAVAARMPPAARLLIHGPKISIGVVGRDADISVAREIAHAAAAYDQQGCVSPHVVYVEKGGVEPRQIARGVADVFAELSVTLPRRQLSHEEALAIRNVRAHAEFKGIAGAASECFGSEDTSYTVIYDEDATLTASCLNRTLYIKPITHASLVPSVIRAHSGNVQSVALAGFSRENALALAAALSECGVTRITTFEQLPWPRMWWHHDGRGPLQELLTWHDLEL